MNFKQYFTEALNSTYNIEILGKDVNDNNSDVWFLNINDQKCAYLMWKGSGFFETYPSFVYDWTENDQEKLENLERQVDRAIERHEKEQRAIKAGATPEQARVINTI